MQKKVSKKRKSLLQRMKDTKSGSGKAFGMFAKSQMRKAKPKGKGIVKALGQKGTTGNFKRIEKSKGKGAAIGALQNKLAKRRGKKIPYKGRQ